ncbi:MAG: type I methionyl aminopeptidase [Deltaproteobacteria bacterium]|jgi:methionyl aminopeptidase|nr:type I methionyl aminopeptidase [Deltaproteobacteria bacterium]
MPLADDTIILKSKDELEKLRRSNIIVAEILGKLTDVIAPGVTGLDLEGICEEELEKRSVKAAFKGYRGYPYCLCVSINDMVVHGFPSKRAFKEGDLISMDFGVLSDGFYGDSAVTVPVGNISSEAARLIDITSTSLDRGIDAVRVGNRVQDISSAVQREVEGAGFSVVRAFVGHGIGRNLHEAPQVPNFGSPGKGMRLKEGMVLAIEPMVNAGGSDVKILDDGWTAVTKDGTLSAHFEHSVAVTRNGPYVLSRV